MSAIEVRIIAGSQAGKRLLLRQPQVTFGRAETCDIVIDLPTASREHGKLLRQDGGVVLQNLSPNGTLLGSRRVTRKARPVRPPAIVAIGDEQAFEIVSVEAGDEPQPAATDQAPAAPAPAGPKAVSGRAKVWIGIGVFWLAVFAIALVVKSSDDTSGDGGLSDVPRLTDEQIKAEIRALPPKQPPDSRLVREYTSRAVEAYNQATSDKSALYEALQAYKTAISYTEDQTLDDAMDLFRYQSIQDRLAEVVIERYNRACNLLRNRRFDRADEAFRELLDIYPAPQTELFQNAQRQWDIAKAELDRR